MTLAEILDFALKVVLSLLSIFIPIWMAKQANDKKKVQKIGMYAQLADYAVGAVRDWANNQGRKVPGTEQAEMAIGIVLKSAESAGYKTEPNAAELIAHMVADAYLRKIGMPEKLAAALPS